MVYESKLSQRFDSNVTVAVCINQASFPASFCQNVTVQNTPKNILQAVTADEKVPFLNYHISRQVFHSTDVIQR